MPRQLYQYLKLLAVAFSLLLIPFTAMQFTEEVNWQLGDFLAMGALLFFFVSCCFLINLFIYSKKWRLLLVWCVILVFILLWAEMAVGIFGSVIAGS